MIEQIGQLLQVLRDVLINSAPVADQAPEALSLFVFFVQWSAIILSALAGLYAAMAICDAGLKVQSMDSGAPVVFGRAGVTYLGAADEHGVIDDPNGALKVGQKLRLVPGHCDPTCNIHDRYIGVRNGQVEVVWPVSARGKSL